MSTKRPARKGNPDLRQQAPCTSTALRVRQSLQRGEPPQRAGSPIEQIEKELFSLLSPTSFKPLRFCSGKDDQKLRERILTSQRIFCDTTATKNRLHTHP
ncbi:MAG: hypothetical protein ACYTXY_21215 [Nostoc sp.]